MIAIRFQHGFLSRGGRRRSSRPGNARVEGFSIRRMHFEKNESKAL